MASLIVILVIVPLIVRRYAQRVETGAADVPDQVHRIRRAQVVASLVVPLLALLALAEGYGEARLLGLRLPRALLAGALLFAVVVYAVGALLCYLAAYPATARLRGLPSQPRQAGGRQARMLVVVLGPQLVYWVLWAVIRAQHGWGQYALLPLAIIYLVAMVVFMPRLMRAMLAKKPVDEEIRQRLLQLAAQQHVRIRAIMRMETGPESTANAMLTGLVPSQRYVFITDRLLSELEPDELDAVFAHELAHARKHHLLIKVAVTMLALALPYAAVFAILAAIPGHRPAGLVVALVALSFVASMAALLLAQGIVGTRLERTADDFASATVGADPLRRGLEKLAAANAMKRRTGRAWNILTQHPGLDQRIERLQAAESAPPAVGDDRQAA